MNKFFSLIFFGDTHGFLNDFGNQRAIIARHKPALILVEQLENVSLKKKEDFKIFLTGLSSKKSKEKKSLINLVRYCFKEKIPLKGIDLKNFGLSERLSKIINGTIIPAKIDLIRLNKLVELREKHHLKKINQGLRTKQRPIMVILGAWHFRKNSPILRSFKDWIAYLPCNKEGRLVVAPPGKREKITYFKEYALSQT